MSHGGRGAALKAQLAKMRAEQERRPGGDSPAGDSPTVAPSDEATTVVAATSATTSPLTSTPSPVGMGDISGPMGAVSLSPSAESVAGSTPPSSIVAGRGRAALIARFAQAQPPATRPGSSSSVTPPPAAAAAATPIASSSVSTGSGSKEPPPVIVKRGKEGRTVPCTANYLQLTVDPDMGIFYYETTFDPQVDNEKERFGLLGQHRDFLGQSKTYDGSKLFLPRPLAEQRMVLKSNSSAGGNINVTLTFKKQIPFGDRESLQLYNILFNRVMKELNMCRMNRNFYNPAQTQLVPQHKLEIWPGFVTAVDEYEGGLQLQIDVSHRVLRQETAFDVLKGIITRAGAGRDIKTEAEKALLGQTIITRYNYKTYKIDDLDFNQNPSSTFEDRNGGHITIADYYLRQYNITIKDAKQPMIVSRPKKRAVSEGAKEIWLVPELCYLTGLTQAMRDDFRVMKDVGTITRVTPNSRQNSLSEFVRQLTTNEKAKACLANWGLQVNPTTVRLDGRVLNPISLHYGKQYSERVGPTADWTRTATSKAVLTPVNLDRWFIVFVDKMKDVAQMFSKTLQQQASRMGINVAQPTPKSLANDRTESYLKAIRESITPQAQLIVTIVPQQRADRYGAIKKLCYVEMPIASQVICFKTISNDKKLNSVVQKIALQINCKMGGELWGCSTPFKNLMVVGVDVFHDPSHQASSVYGFVASMNASFSRWHSTTCEQRTGQELTDALKTSFTTSLTKYHQNNHCFPDSIVMFRDGVGDGQLAATSHEIRQLISAFEACNGNYKPKFVFVVVQKRINTRIYSQMAGKPDGWDNPLPGTVVDYHITRRHWYDFFLVSQKVNQGTVSPSHFVVVHDQSNIPPDRLQMLAYTLTHMYYNWPGTVRVPAPCQYAHKLAAMAGEHLHKAPNPALGDKLFYL